MVAYERIRLLVEEQGRRVWKVFQGEWLVGTVMSDHSTLGLPADDRKRWGHKLWHVVRGARGKLVVFKRAAEDEAGEMRIFDSFAEMEPNIPPDIFEDAALRAGIRKPEQYPEEFIDV